MQRRRPATSNKYSLETTATVMQNGAHREGQGSEKPQIGSPLEITCMPKCGNSFSRLNKTTWYKAELVCSAAWNSTPRNYTLSAWVGKNKPYEFIGILIISFESPINS